MKKKENNNIIKNLFSKIKELFRKIFTKEEKYLLNEKNSNESNSNENVSNENKVKDSNIRKKREQYEVEKERILKIYANLKNGKIQADDLLITDLIQVTILLRNEKSLYAEKISEQEQKLNELDKRITSLVDENTALKLKTTS